MIVLAVTKLNSNHYQALKGHVFLNVVSTILQPMASKNVIVNVSVVPTDQLNPVLNVMITRL